MSLYEPRFVASWPTRPLWETAEWTNGLAFRSFAFSDDGDPVIKIAELKGGISGQTKFTRQAFDPKYRVRPGDVLYSWSGNPETSLDVFVWDGPAGWLNQHIFKVEVVEGLDRGFHVQLLRYLRPNLAGIAANKQTTGLGHVTQQDMRRIVVAIPPLPEQRRIAAILGALDDKIELNRKMNRTLEEMAQALFKSWFIDFDGHDDLVESEIGPVPRGWRAGALADVAEITMGQSPPGSTYNEWGGGLPFFQGATDFGAVFPTNRVYCTAPSRFADNWDVLISVRAPVGRTNLAVERCAIGRGVASIRSRHGRHPAYMWCLIHSLSASLDVYNGEGTVFGSINKNALHALPVIVAPTANIDAFEGKAGPLLSRLRLTDQESRTLATLRDTLLPKLISGELRVPEAEAAVSEAL